MKGHIIPGSPTHFALIGSPWHFNLLRGQEHADMMAFARAVWDAALAHAAEPVRALPLSEWRDEYGPVVWWNLSGWAWIGTPDDDDWPSDHRCWTPHPLEPLKPPDERKVAWARAHLPRSKRGESND